MPVGLINKNLLNSTFLRVFNEATLSLETLKVETDRVYTT